MSGDARTRAADLSGNARAQLLARARAARAAHPPAPTIPVVPRDGKLPLSYAQQRFWLLDQLTPSQVTYKTPWVLRLAGPMDIDAYARALDALVARHEVLRCRFPSEDGVPHTAVDPPGRVPLEVIDLTDAPDGVREERMRSEVLARVQRPVSLAGGPMIRAMVARLAAEDHVVMVDMHHIVTDAWSMGIFTQELLRLYAAAQAGAPDPLPPLAVGYVDYAAWQRDQLTAEGYGKRLGYWTDRLAGLTEVDLPSDRPRPANPTGAGASYVATLPEELHAAGEALASAYGVRLHTVVHAAFCALMTRYTGAHDIAVGMSFSGRTRSEFEALIGCFVNTLVLRVGTEGDPTFRELLARTEETLLGAHEYQDVPFDQVVDALAPVRDVRRTPLFSILFGFQDAPPKLAGVRAELVPFALGTSRFDASIKVNRAAGEPLNMGFEYSTELFDTDRIERIARHYAILLGGAIAAPDRRISELPLLDEADEAVVLAGPRRPLADPAGRTVVDQFRARAAERPDRVAITAPDGSLTYAEVDRASDRLAARLRAAGAGPEKVVGLNAARGTAYAIGVFGILKTGAAFLPIDPEQPPARREAMLAAANAIALVGAGGIDPVTQEQADGEEADAQPPAAIDPATLAYVIFTSGSTGEPKGVAVAHRNLLAHLDSIGPALRGASEPAIAAPTDAYGEVAHYPVLTTLAADLAHTMVFLAMTTGGTLHVVDGPTATDPTALAAWMRRTPVEYIKLVPSHMEALLNTADPGDAAGLLPRRAVMLGGEVVSWELVDRIRALRPGMRIVNHYGPTEATIGVFAFDIPDQPAAERPPTVCIGRPLPHVIARIVDRDGRAVPIGIAGDLYLGGPSVSRGYVNRPALTADRYGPDPSRDGGTTGRFYRTGDRARWRADGTVEFLGRSDGQVKILGYRVEPGEVTAVLVRHPSVASAAVMARDGRLIAYLVPDGPAPSVNELRTFLGGVLPPYMVPSTFAVLDALPLNANGKINWHALPDPSGSRPDLGVAFVAPTSEVERRMAALWSGVLGVDRIGTLDNFFTLGGNSLQATQLVSRIRSAFGVALDLRTFFANPTVAGLSALPGMAATLDTDALDLLASIEDLTDEEVRALLDAREEETP